MHYRSVIHLQGILLSSLAVAMLLPLPFSLYYQSGDHWALLLSAAITAVVGFTIYRMTDINRSLRSREGFAIVTFGWIGFSLFGCLPYIFTGAIPSFTDAFFETISGFTTTGATILTDVEALPHGLLFWRSLTHWLGGMGIIVLSLAILPFLGVGGMQLFKAEVPGPVADKLTPRITETAKILWGVYMLLSAAETILLMFGGMTLFDALCHTFGTMATGGYSTRNASVGAYNSAYIDYIIVFFMFLAGANFSLHYRFLRGQWQTYWRDREFLVYFGIVAVATLCIVIDLLISQNNSMADAVRSALFQVVSIQTTTGYGTADYEQWTPSSQYILWILMFIGGCAGSTGGGMKVMRLHLLFKFSLTEFTRLLHPNAVVPVRMRKVAIPRDVITNILGFFVLYIFVFAFGVFILTLLGVDILTALGASIATLANIGPGLAEVGPTDNYAAIPALGKWTLSFLMLMGRLEIFTVLVLFSPAFWKK